MNREASRLLADVEAELTVVRSILEALEAEEATLLKMRERLSRPIFEREDN